ncbi:histidine kinase [Pedobacter sp. MC2016-24]|uniref:histidine kinase n=1 Tax=Pedobacter sp. MC2016-24 TaxID=2780090 RepID=UPI00187FF9F6|nr:histidine kinase [Pedobacter sp. MC2016-24]MBE9601241.1 histidine kinase [Pedobacter sp. MC2016-24]
MQRLVLLFVVMLSLCSCKSEVRFQASSPVFKTGDDLKWANKHHDDNSWKTDRDNKRDEVFWTRYHISLNSKTEVNKHLGLEVYAFGAFEVYWDGVKIGENGKFLLEASREVPGTYRSCYLLPDSLNSPGLHLLALRGTQYYKSDLHRSPGVRIEYYAESLTRPLIIASIMNLMAGVFLMVALYYLFLLINSNKKNHATLVFSITCFLFLLLLIAEYCKFYVDIPYPYFYTRLEIIGLLTFAIALLVPLYFSMQFNFNKKGWLIGILCCVLILVYLINYRRYDLTARILSGIMLLASMVVAVQAISNKEKGGVMILCGLMISFLINNILFYDFGIFICFTIIVLCMLYLHTIRAKEDDRAYQASLLLSSRLKLQLLKKNIQPHFIKNTLTSLIDWVEESPKQGVVFINALAAEFDLMNEISEATLIPISSEIALCKAHLLVMEFRKEIKYIWSDFGIEASEMIPPAILHTLLENGITHSMPFEEDKIYFELTFKRTENHRAYTFITKAKNRSGRSGKRGTGFQYVAARLTESYGDKWEFESGEIAVGWFVRININD